MTVKIRGTIGDSWWGECVTAKDVEEQLRAEDGDEVVVAINSHGGDPFEGLAIARSLERHDAQIIVEVDGLAASAATLIMMAADEIRMPASALMMIHNAWTWAAGDHHDMRKAADTLETITGAMMEKYKKRFTGSDEELTEMLDDETWLSAADAQAVGFSDVTIDDADEDEVAAAIFSQFEERRRVAAKVDKVTAFDDVPLQVAAMVNRGAEMSAKFTKASKANQRPVVASAGTPQRGAENMEPEEQNAGASSAPQTEEQTVEAPAKTAARTSEDPRALIKKIKARCEGAGVDPADALEIASTADDMTQAQDMIIDALAKQNDVPEFSGRAPIVGGKDASDKFKEGAVAGIRMRATSVEMDLQNEFRGKSLLQLAEQCIRMSGKRVPRTRQEIFQMALGSGGKGVYYPDANYSASTGTHSTSHFPTILKDVMHKEMLLGYERTPVTWDRIARPTDLADFRAKELSSLNVFDNLPEVPEGGEYTMLTIGERGASIKGAVYGGKTSITLQTLINDDLGHFTRVTQKLGAAAAQVPERLVYDVLKDNATFKGQALFHSDRNNTTSDTFSYDTVHAMRQAMAEQVVETGNGEEEPINVDPRLLVVPSALWRNAMELNSAAHVDSNLQPNILQNAFDVIEAKRLNDNATRFFLLSDPLVADTIAIGFVDGMAQPQLFQKEDWDVDQTLFKVRIASGSAPYDFKAMQRAGV